MNLNKFSMSHRLSFSKFKGKSKQAWIQSNSHLPKASHREVHFTPFRYTNHSLTPVKYMIPWKDG